MCRVLPFTGCGNHQVEGLGRKENAELAEVAEEISSTAGPRGRETFQGPQSVLDFLTEGTTGTDAEAAMPFLNSI